MIAGGTKLLWWNEGNFVATEDALNQANSVTQELGDINQVDLAKNGQLVYATGLAETKAMLTDPVFGVSANAMRLTRKVEFFQWVEEARSQKRQKIGGGEETVTTYTYTQKWVSRPVNSGNFKDPNATITNRNFVLANVEDFEEMATDVNLGAYRLPESMVRSISGTVPLGILMSEEKKQELNRQLFSAAQSAAQPPQRSFTDVIQQGAIRGVQSAITGTPVPSATTGSVMDRMRPGGQVANMERVHISGNIILLGASPGVPQVGDVRVTFTEIKPTATVSLIAKLNGNTFEQYRADNGKTFMKLVMGTQSLQNMYEDAQASNVTMTWVWRFVGAFMVIGGLRMIFAPLAVLASVIPFLGSIVGAGTGLVSFLLGAAWSLLIIAIAWLRFRPIIGFAMIGVAVALIIFLFIRGRSRKAATFEEGVAQ